MGRLHLITTGGTIAMGAVRPDEAATLEGGSANPIEAVPAAAALADWRIDPLLSKPSASLDFADLARIARAVETSEADGVVITHGTDTLEETAFYLQVAVDPARPVVVTGAMRASHAPGADGPANLLAAARVALAPEARGMGVLVVIDDEIHAAAFVRKTHTSRVHAFSSAPLGPIGWVVEGRPRFLAAPLLRPPRLEPGPRPTVIPVIELGAGGSPAEIRAAAGVADGLVLSVPGGGHVGAACMPVIRQTAEHLPLVIATRTGGGEMLRASYGYPGSEVDLAAAGTISAGVLDARKARIMLHLLLSQGATRAEVAKAFGAL